jgi:hypothetical protein
MGTMGRLLKRFGYIKLSDYGLCLTSEGTVEPLFKPTPMPLPRPARVMDVAVPLPAVPAPMVAAAAEPEEDDWEWHIAIARARAVADDIDQAVVELDTPKVVRLDTPKRKASNTQPLAAMSPQKTPVTDKTVPYAENPFHESWEAQDSRTPRAVVKTVVRRSSLADTIIPVPKMPTMSEPRRLEPVVRAKPSAQAPVRRIAKGTGPGVVTEETIRMSPTALPPAAVDDATRPGLLLPSVTKRAAAR